ncbi:hypothetical protein [Actinomadura sp. 7K507]|uniref:hypothetical protein n=1 Tax=Actinomadura sp. 7K507 TaxID=2530365 RepID=UPI001051378C|nr:hypothetical protein [Actinomadura sp. 7K507]TDC77591.1 hypothetical protein E1285_38530 [Actinomadura sp. 7K507]
MGSESSSSRQVDRQGDGGISVSTSDESGFGVRADVWIEGDLPGIVEMNVGIGGGLLWTNSDQDKFTFTDDDQMNRFYGRVERESYELLDEGGFEALDELGDVPFEVAEDMGIPYTHIDASGPSAFAEVSGELAPDTGTPVGRVYDGVLEGEHSRLIGTSESVDADGRMTTGEYYSITNELSGALNTGVTLSVDGRVVEGTVAGTAGPNLSTSQSNIVHIEYDEDGNPERINSTTTTQFHTGVQGTIAVGVDVDSVNPTGQVTGGAEYEHTEYVQNGDVTVTSTTLEIPPDMRDRFRDTSPQDWSGQDFDFTELQESADISSTIQRYDSHIDGDEDGFSLPIGVGVPGLEVGGTPVDWGSTTETNQMGLEAASYRDPVTGEWRDWVTCRERD